MTTTTDQPEEPVTMTTTTDLSELIEHIYVSHTDEPPKPIDSQDAKTLDSLTLDEKKQVIFEGVAEGAYWLFYHGLQEQGRVNPKEIVKVLADIERGLLTPILSLNFSRKHGVLITGGAADKNGRTITFFEFRRQAQTVN